MLKNIKNDSLITALGGDSTQVYRDLFVKGINMIGVPKTIDNIACTDITLDIILLFRVATDA